MEPRWVGTSIAALLSAACSGAPGSGTGDDSRPPSGSTSPGTAGPAPETGTGGPEREPPASTGSSSSGLASSGIGPTPSTAGTSTGEPVDPGPHFVDVTAEAGLDFDPGPLYAPPFCLVDSLHGEGDYCLPEHFLGAAAVGDFDEDGWPDVFLTRLDAPGLLMRNRGDGTFEDVTDAVGLEQAHISGGASWLDVEGDGDLDLMLAGFATLRNYLYVNDGSGSFDERAIEHGLDVASDQIHLGTGIGVGDYDLDGYVDVFVGDWRHNLVIGEGRDHNRLLHNRGAAEPGVFDDVTVAMDINLQKVSEIAGALPGAFGFAPAFVDLDGDHWPELTLAGDYGTSRLYWNNGAGRLADGTDAAGVASDAYGMGSALGDYDGDGDLDWFITGIWREDGPRGNRLFRNDGDRRFAETTDAVGVREGRWAWGAAFFDADHDGDLDLVQAAGWPTVLHREDPVLLWINEGAGPWPERAVSLGVDFTRGSRGLVTFDYDRDGDLDLLVHANTEPPALYRNDGAPGSWLQVRAVGEAGNSRGLGTEVRVQAQPDGPWRVRHIGVGGHFFGQEDAVAHFGLGEDAGPLHRVEITWPRSGRVEVLEDVSRDQVLVVYE